MKEILILSSNNSLFFEPIVKYFKNRTDVKFKFLTDNLNALSYKNAQKLKFEAIWLDKDEIKNYLMSKNFDLIIVDDFNQILDKEIVEKNKIISLHFSKLPKYRLRSPIKETFINKDLKAGFSIYRLNENLYDGQILYQKEMNVDPKWDLKKLENNLYSLAFKYYPIIIEKLIGLNVLIIGNDGREHAIAEKILKSPYLNKLYFADCNDYILKYGEKVEYTDLKNLVFSIKALNINFVIANNSRYFQNGLVELLKKNDIKILAPNKKDVLLETSKIYAKRKLTKYDFKIALYKEISNKKDIDKFLSYFKNPIIKADGLTSSKGVYVNQDKEKIKNELYKYLDGKFEKSSKTSLIEESLFGFETTLYTLWDGQKLLHLPLCQNFKQNNEGLYSEPIASICPFNLNGKNNDKLKNYLNRLELFFQKEKFKSSFILCSDLIVADDDIYVLELNFGLKKCDAENLMSYIQNDWLEVLYNCSCNMLDYIKLAYNDKQYTTIAMTSKGYPLKSVIGDEISNINTVKQMFDNVKIYFSNIIMNGDRIISNGGRVLSVTSKDKSVIYRIMSHIKYCEKAFKDNVEVQD